LCNALLMSAMVSSSSGPIDLAPRLYIAGLIVGRSCQCHGAMPTCAHHSQHRGRRSLIRNGKNRGKQLHTHDGVRRIVRKRPERLNFGHDIWWRLVQGPAFASGLRAVQRLVAEGIARGWQDGPSTAAVQTGHKPQSLPTTLPLVRPTQLGDQSAMVEASHLACLGGAAAVSIYRKIVLSAAQAFAETHAVWPIVVLPASVASQYFLTRTDVA
jgi:hypothetical protein